MARIAGVNIPTKKRLVAALTYIYGVGPKTARDICKKAKMDESIRVEKLGEAEAAKLREVMEADFQVEGDLRREVAMNLKRLGDINCYRGIRHRKGLPTRGQRTHTNARTRRKRSLPIAGKKKV